MTDKRTISSHDILLISTPNLPVAVNTTAATVQYQPKRREITTRICKQCIGSWIQFTMLQQTLLQ